MTTNTAKWIGKRVVLLGGASLIGTHLAKALIKMPLLQLKIVDDLSAGKLSNVQPLVRQNAEFWQADLREYSAARKAVRNMDIVFHLAAQHGGRGYVASHPVELYDNLALDATIFRACAQEHVEKVIFSSSACAYPVDLQTDVEQEVRLSEGMIDYQHMRDADGPYGREKLLGEMMLDAYVEQGYFKGVSTRSFTVYGPLMNESHAIAALIAKTMLKQEPFEIWGKDGLQLRNWTYVEDNVAGALLAAEQIDRGAINIGIEERLNPNIACSYIWKIMGFQPVEIVYKGNAPVGPLNRIADATKLKALGWKPSVTFEQGLRRTIDWYVSTHKVEDLKQDFERKLTER